MSLRPVSLGLLSGVLIALSFPIGAPLPVSSGGGWWPAAWICLAPLMVASSVATSAAAAGWAGFAGGLASFLLILAWIQPFLVRWAHLPAAASLGFLLLLCAYLALFASAFCLCIHMVSMRMGYRAALLIAPAAWTGLELARARLLTGFPWCLLGTSQHEFLPAIQVAELGGVYAVSFVLACSSALVAILVMAWSRRREESAPVVEAILLAAIVVSALVYGAWRLWTMPPAADGIEVALIQPNVEQTDKWDPAERDRIEAAHVAMTRRAVEGGAAFILWSESSVPASITQDGAYRLRVELLAGEAGADIVLGSVAVENGGDRSRAFNSAFLVRSDRGLSGRYDKMRLVPFGEYVPLRSFLTFIEPIVEGAGDFEPGVAVAPLKGALFDVGALICYEAIFPELARAWARSGADLLVAITNDAWYDDTAMPRQHLIHSVLRAVETRRYLLRCAATGISAIVGPTGRVLARSELREEAILRGRVAAMSGGTLYAATGDAFALACGIMAILVAVLSRSRRTHGAGQPPGGDHAV